MNIYGTELTQNLTYKNSLDLCGIGLPEKT